MQLFQSNLRNSFSISIWLLILTLMTFFMIVIGGLTRLTESGLSITDWKPLIGIIPPLNNEAWIDVFNKYKITPEYQIVNTLMTLSEFKYIYWWEWFHRFFARCMGLFFIFPFLYFLIKKQLSKELFITLLIVFLFGLFQALVGWWMVKSGLNENPYVSAYRLTFHLINALIIFSILFWTFLNSILGKNISNQNNKIINILFNISLFILLVTIISGGFMAGTNSGKSFNTFPLMNGNIIPNDYFFYELGLLNSFENTVAINFNHRWLGSFTFIFIFAFSLYLLISTKIKKNILKIFLILITIGLQFFLGILTLINNVPLTFASLHQTNSVLLLAAILFAYHRHRYK
mgnify:CR=1 FL=1